MEIRMVKESDTWFVLVDDVVMFCSKDYQTACNYKYQLETMGESAYE